MKSSIPLSVVIGVRDRDDILIRSLWSLHFQGLRKYDYEIIVVNYGGRISLKKKLLKERFFIRYRYIYVNDHGIFNEARAKNIGIRASGGNFIISLNADIILSKNLLKNFLRIVNNSNDTVLYQIQRINLSKGDTPNNKNELLKFLNTPLDNLRYSISNKKYQGEFQATHFNNWKNIGGFDERMSGWGYLDIDLSSRMKDAGIKQVWLDYLDFPIFHQYHPVTRSALSMNDPNSSLSIASRRLTKQLVNNNWGRTQKKLRILILVKMEFIMLKDFVNKNVRVDFYRRNKVPNKIILQDVYDYAIDHKYNYLVEVNYFNKEVRREIFRIFKSNHDYLCIFISFYKHMYCFYLIEKLLQWKYLCPDIKVFDARAVAILVNNHRSIKDQLFLKSDIFGLITRDGVLEYCNLTTNYKIQYELVLIINGISVIISKIVRKIMNYG